jgi:SOS response regulatory protein OraA/RecX
MKGIDAEIIRDISGSASEEDELGAALAAAEKKLRTARSRFSRLEPEVRKQRIAQFLTQRGFGWETIRKVLTSMENEITGSGND